MPTREKKAKVSLTKFMRAAYMKKTMEDGLIKCGKASHTIARCCDAYGDNTEWRRVKLLGAFEREQKFMLWHFKKELAGIRNQKSADFMKITKVVKKLEDAVSSDESKGKILIDYSAMMKCIYMLDYNIFKANNIRTELTALKKIPEVDMTEEEYNRLPKLIEFNKYLVKKQKYWRSKLTGGLEDDVFGCTHFVDQE